jgi:hypothetical protein
MVRWLFALVFVVLVAISSWALAQLVQPNTSFTILGQGLESCGKWSMLRQQNQADVEEAWVDGVISDQAMARSTKSGKSVTLSTDASGVWGWIDNYCSANPTQSIEVATMMFLLEANVFRLSAP